MKQAPECPVLAKMKLPSKSRSTSLSSKWGQYRPQTCGDSLQTGCPFFIFHSSTRKSKIFVQRCPSTQGNAPATLAILLLAVADTDMKCNV